MSDKVRILRVLEYVGPRDTLERVLEQNAVKGQRTFGAVTIREGVIGSWPEVIETAPAGPLERLLRLAENLTPSGVIGDGMVAEFHSLAEQVRTNAPEPNVWAERAAGTWHPGDEA